MRRGIDGGGGLVAEPDYYAVLGVAPDASAEAVHAAWRRLIRRHHPDANPGPEAHALAARINAAHETLGDPERRVRYDDRRRRAAGTATPPSPEAAEPRPDDPPSTPSSVKSGRTATGELDAVPPRRVRIRPPHRPGHVIRVKVPRLNRCPECLGRSAHRPDRVTSFPPAGCSACHAGRIMVLAEMRLRLPHMLHDGAVLVLPGEGDEPLRGPARGDLHVILSFADGRTDGAEAERDTAAEEPGLEADLEAYVREREQWRSEEPDVLPPVPQPGRFRAVAERIVRISRLTFTSPAAFSAGSIIAGTGMLSLVQPEWGVRFFLAALLTTAVGAYVAGLRRG